MPRPMRNAMKESRISLHRGLVICILTSTMFLGCASGPGGQRAAGGASYHYERTSDGAVVADVATTRDIDSALIQVDPDGTLYIEMRGAVSNADVYLDTISQALDKIPGMK